MVFSAPLLPLIPCHAHRHTETSGKSSVYVTVITETLIPVKTNCLVWSCFLSCSTVVTTAFFPHLLSVLIPNSSHILPWIFNTTKSQSNGQHTPHPRNRCLCPPWAPSPGCLLQTRGFPTSRPPGLACPLASSG